LIAAIMFGLPLGFGSNIVGNTSITLPILTLILPFGGSMIGIFSGLFFGVAAALFPGLLGINLANIEYVEALSWSRPQKPHLLFGLTVALILGLLFTLFMWSLSRSLPLGLITGSLIGLPGGLIVIVSGNLFNWHVSYGQKISQFITNHIYKTKGGFYNSLITQITHPLQRVHNSLKYALYLGAMGMGLILLTGLVIGLVVGILDGEAFGIINFIYRYFVDDLQNKLAAGLLYGLFIGLSFGWIVGWTMALRPLMAVMQHYILRFILTRTNCISPQTIPFLDEMVAHLILRRVGGGRS
jgi:hypothetical protein